MSEPIPAVLPRSRRLSPDAARVALVLIASWVLVATLKGLERVWFALWDRQTLAGAPWHSGSGHVPQPPGLAVDAILLLLEFVTYPSVFAGGVLGMVYLAVARRGWWRAGTFALASLGGAVAAGVLAFTSRWADLDFKPYSWQGVWWALAGLAAPLIVAAVAWLLLRHDVSPARREP